MGRPPLRPQQENIREGQVRRRTRSTDDKYAIPAKYKAPGVSYEWKTEEILGAPHDDPSYMPGLMDNGWEAVPLKEMPDMGRENQAGVIRRGGQILMKRPIELTREARVEDFQIARSQVNNNTAKMTGTNPAAGMPVSASSRVTTNYAPGTDEFEVSKIATTPLTSNEMKFDD